jgi:mono/diheme cytochrome c family protein
MPTFLSSSPSPGSQIVHGGTLMRWPLSIAPALCLLVWIGDGALSAEAQKPYTIKDGKVDQHTYNGWRRYTESCLRCHGPDGAGSSYAPDLTLSLKSLSEDDFKEVVVNGRVNVNASSENVMPPFGEVEDVVLYLDDIYAYLKARSDGVLDRGRPQRLGH